MCQLGSFDEQQARGAAPTELRSEQLAHVPHGRVPPHVHLQLHGGWLGHMTVNIMTFYGPLAKLKAQLLERFVIIKIMQRDQQREPSSTQCINVKVTTPANHAAVGAAVSLCQHVAVVALEPSLFALNPALRVVRGGVAYKWDVARQGLVLDQLR
jgi:hypothetical protein